MPRGTAAPGSRVCILFQRRRFDTRSVPLTANTHFLLRTRDGSSYRKGSAQKNGKETSTRGGGEEIKRVNVRPPDSEEREGQKQRAPIQTRLVAGC